MRNSEVDENLVMTHSLNRGQVTLSANSDDEPLFFPLNSLEFPVGAAVDLFHSQEKVGTGRVMEKGLIHGNPVPPGFTKICILTIDDNIRPFYATQFDDEYLTKDSITVRPCISLCLK